MQANEESLKIFRQLYFAGWIEKEKYPELSKGGEIYEDVQDKLRGLGLELVDKSYCKWYVIRLFKENDSFAEYHQYHGEISSRHLALLLILYSKLLLPIRLEGWNEKEELQVSFSEVFQMYGYKFRSGKRKIASEQNVRGLFTGLCKMGYIIKPHGKSYYLAGPLMYALHDDLLENMAEGCYQVLYGIEKAKED